MAWEGGEAAQERSRAVAPGRRAGQGAMQSGERAVGGEDHRQAGGGHRAHEVGEGCDVAAGGGATAGGAQEEDAMGQGEAIAKDGSLAPLESADEAGAEGGPPFNWV